MKKMQVETWLVYAAKSYTLICVFVRLYVKKDNDKSWKPSWYIFLLMSDIFYCCK